MPRFTLSGSAELESHIGERLAALTALLRPQLERSGAVGLYLVGGYGRGEGGSLRGETANNFDLYLVGPDLGRAVEEAARAVDLPCDLSCSTLARFQRQKTTLFLAEAAAGHRTLWGEEALWNQVRHPLAAVPATEFEALLTNRATLLLINESQALSEERRCRHTAKAVLGFGDAWLASRRRYSCSYREKLRRVAESPELAGAFRDLYAAAYRYRAEGTPFAWGPECLKSLAQVWSAIRPLPVWTGPRSLAWLLHEWSYYPAALRLAWAPLGPRRALSRILPWLLFGLSHPDLSRAAASRFRITGSTRQELLTSYLRAWSYWNDPSYHASLRRSQPCSA